MPSTEVTALYRAAVAAGVRVWIDGGWCVDALVGEQTRERHDLHVAVDSDSVDALIAVLTTTGYRYDATETSSDWNFVMVDNVGYHIDIHVFHFDDDGQHAYGVAYPQEALQGNGVVDGQPVAGITARLMLQFKTAYEPASKDQVRYTAAAEVALRMRATTMVPSRTARLYTSVPRPRSAGHAPSERGES